VPKEVKGSIRFGFVRGGKSETNGAFAEYIKQEWDITAEVPKNVTPAQAASAPIPREWRVIRCFQEPVY
jgi:NADPH:quinone reductase-like Zn-dependent oxidoreductase